MNIKKQNTNDVQQGFTWQCLHSQDLLLLETLPSVVYGDLLDAFSSPADTTPTMLKLSPLLSTDPLMLTLHVYIHNNC